MVIFYDNFCPMCTANARLWKKMDRHNRLFFYSFRDLPEYPEAMEESLHVRHKGRWYVGYEAIIQIGKQLPALWITLPLLYMVKILGLGELLYTFIARNRKLIPVNQCSDGTCAIPKKN